MLRIKSIFIVLLFSLTVFTQHVIADESLKTIIDNSSTRSDKNKARDEYRHPYETLTFFGIQSNMNVLEILPGGGWYTEILAPYLKDNGELTATSFGSDHPTEYLRNVHNRFMQKLSNDPENYSKIKPSIFKLNDSDYLADVNDASQDMVVTFRNTHNWIRYGGIEEVFTAFNRVLKPGGILGIVQHRAKADASAEDSAQQGYVPEKYLIRLIESKGFELVDKSEVNANSKDTKNHPKGVWSLPPSYRGGDDNKAAFTAIGESDRMTLKFIKLK